DNLFHRGDLDEALRILREVVLPALEVLGDLDGICKTNWQIARLIARPGIDSQEKFDAVFSALATAYDLALKVGRPDAIGAVGWDLGQFLAANGALDQAKAVLTQSYEAFNRLGNEPAMNAISKLLADLEKKS
ncbi:MAG: hypothetical protein KDA57_22340, partial [Planctomycetales bacterium]|nr:hypothetical protein [Planctomycetales bacterium]